MKILITGICGFVGSQLASAFLNRLEGAEVFGIDNLMRPGSEMNRRGLARAGVRVFHGDLRMPSDLIGLPACDWVIDAAANPSVLAGVDAQSSSRQVSEHNLLGTINLLEYCRQHRAGLILLSTSRVYSIRELSRVPVVEKEQRFQLQKADDLPRGVSAAGIREDFSTASPVSLYGATKLASEIMALEYGATYQFPVWVNRCGVLAGAGQFGTAEQGIFSYWLHAHAERRRLRYIGFNGKGYQVRDAFHPSDLAELLLLQVRTQPPTDPIFHASGGEQNSMSLAELNQWCDERFGVHHPERDLTPRPFDLPWIVMDHSRVTEHFGWQPQVTLLKLLDEIGQHVAENPGWLAQCGVA